MNEISSGVAFWILEAWRKMETQLQVDAFTGKDKSAGSPAVILRTAPNEESISLVALDTKGQKLEWRLSLKTCKFGFGVDSDGPFPELIEGFFVSCLVADMPEDRHVIFRERFVDTDAPLR